MHPTQLRFTAPIALAIGVLLTGCGTTSSSSKASNGSAASNGTPSLNISAGRQQLALGSTLQFTAEADSKPLVQGVTWSVAGGAANGSISTAGLYTAPSTLPSGPISIDAAYEGASAFAQVIVTNPTPQVSNVSPSLVNIGLTTVMISGQGFVPGSTAMVNGAAVPTHYVDTSHVSADVTAAANIPSTLAVCIDNPNPGAASSNAVQLTVTSSPMTLAPNVLSGGDISLTVTVPGVGAGSVILVNGRPLSMTAASGNSVTGTGFLAPWLSGTVPVQVTKTDGSTILAEGTEPISATAVSFDTAARFATQAAWGPRPDVVMHIQQVGLEQFLQEQFQQPIGSYNPDTTNIIRSFYLNTTNGNSLLRLRTAWALQTIMPGQSFFSNFIYALPWEERLEGDAFTNYRQILLDSMSDPNLTSYLSLTSNVSSPNPNVHPNQNFARESMQLFSIGTVMLNQDGTMQTDPTGKPIPTYDDTTVDSMSRLLTGWTYAKPVEPDMTDFGIDFSQTLVPNENNHDHSSKTLFGNLTIPGGQTAVEDRDSVLDALMNHQNVAPFISRILIQRFVKSQPSPAYVGRVANVFANNGMGVKGDMKAVITAVLLDPEARAGDTAGTSSDGFLQDVTDQQLFMMGVLGISGEDDQSTYLSGELSEPFLNPPTVFGYFATNYLVPGTTINSPEFQILSNFTDIQRSQLIWSIVSRQQPGFNNGFAGWLYEHFNNVPDMVDALNHLLYHGTMTSQQQDVIKNYCSGISDPQLQLESAVFLSLVGDSYLVAH